MLIAKISLVVAVLMMVVLYTMKSIIMVYRHSIVVRDLSYSLVIDNYSIKLIKLVDKLPVITNFVKGYKLWHRIKGICTVVSPRPKNGRFSDVSMIVENKKSNCFIEIETTFGFVYINRKNEEVTKKLYDEMMETIHFVEDNELEMPDKIGKPKTLALVIFVLIAFSGGLWANILINNLR